MSQPIIFNITIVISDTFIQQYQLSTCNIANPTVKPTGILTGPLTIGSATFTPIDLTGSGVVSQIRRTIGKTETELLGFTVIINDAVNGLFTTTLTATQTGTLTINDKAVDTHYIQVTDTGGVVKTYITGDVQLIGL